MTSVAVVAEALRSTVTIIGVGWRTEGGVDGRSAGHPSETKNLRAVDRHRRRRHRTPYHTTAGRPARNDVSRLPPPAIIRDNDKGKKARAPDNKTGRLRRNDGRTSRS